MPLDCDDGRGLVRSEASAGEVQVGWERDAEDRTELKLLLL